MIRRLGRRWTQLHRLVYVAAIGGVLAAYLRIARIVLRSIGAPAALMNAITDAIGVKDLAMPATPQTVWRAMQNRKAA